MAFDRQRKDNTGNLFKNDKQPASDKHPEYGGQATIGGIEYWISAWVNESQKDGKKYFKLAFKEKEPAGARQGQGNYAQPPPTGNRYQEARGGGQQGGGQQQQPRRNFDRDPDDSIPF